MGNRDFICGLTLGLSVGVATCVSVLISLKVFNRPRKSGTPKPLVGRQRNTRASTHLTGNFVRISDLEKSFFHGIDRKAALTEAQVRQLKDFLEGSVGEGSVERLRECGNLAEILHLLCTLGLVQPTRYRLIMTILENSRIGVNVERLLFHVEGLEQAVSDIEEGLNPRDYERDLFELDVLIIHTDEDREATFRFKEHLEADSGIRGLSVQAYEEFCSNKTFFSALGDVFKRTRYIFVFMTRNMVSAELERFLTEMALVDSLTNERKNYRIVPVWTTRERLDVPEMRPFPGIRYWQYTGGIECMQQVYLNNLNRVLMKGREDFVRA